MNEGQPAAAGRAPGTSLHVRPLEAGDDAEIRRIFRQTVVLGRSAPFPLPDLDRYEHLCLGWYLDEGRPWAAVLVRTDDDAPTTAAAGAAPIARAGGGPVVGYLLACPDTTAHARWLRRPALAFTARVLSGLAVGRYERPARTFWWLRLRDGWRSWREGIDAPMPMHVHLNLDPSVRATAAGRLLVDHADAVGRAHGLDGWFGEVNARAGHRAGALVRLGATVVHRTPNLTFSWVQGQPVERLTVVRHLDAAGAAAPPDVRERRAGRPSASSQSSSTSRSDATADPSTPMPAA